MRRADDGYYHRESPPFVLEGVSQFVEVIDARQTVRRCLWPSREVIEEIVIPLTHTGCHISEFNVSGSGAWISTERISGQGEWGYDILRTAPLLRIGGVDECRGYISEAPRFAADESRIAVFAGRWLNWLGDEDEMPSPGGYVNVGWLSFHSLPGMEESDHEVVVHLPAGWKAEVEKFRWRMPKEVTPVGSGVRMIPSGGVPVEIPGPLAAVIVLPAPHPPAGVCCNRRPGTGRTRHSTRARSSALIGSGYRAPALVEGVSAESFDSDSRSIARISGCDRPGR